MKTRFFTSIGIVLVLILAFILKFYVSNYFFDALILLITCISSYEASKIFGKTGKYNNKLLSVIFPAFLMLILLICINFDSQIGIIYTIVMMVASIILFFLITFLITLVNRKNTKIESKTINMDKHVGIFKFSFLKSLNNTLVFIYPAFLLSFLVLINHFEDMTTSFSKISQGNGLISLVVLLFAFLIPIFTDTFAYLMGGLIGGKKLAPKISPNKTIAGAVGGLLWCVLLSVVVICIFNSIPAMASQLSISGINIWRIIAISAIGSVISQLGDLFESYLKRSAKIKDSGAIFPGHGGMLDRFDSYIFLAPYLFIAFSILFTII